MCDTLAAELLNSDVFGSHLNTTLNTPLQTYCESLDDVYAQFNEFCLFPSSDDLDPICIVDPAVKSDSSFIFNRLQDGTITELNQLPVLLETPIELVGNNTEWVDIETQSGVITLESMDLQRLPYFVMSQTGIVLGVTSIAASTTYVVSSPINSLFYEALLPSGAASILGTNLPMIAISADGNVRVIGPYVWTAFTQVWTLIDPALSSWMITSVAITTLGDGRTFIVYLGSPIPQYELLNTYVTPNSSTTSPVSWNSVSYNSVYTTPEKGFLFVQGQIAIYGLSVGDPSGNLNYVITYNIVNKAIVSAPIVASTNLNNLNSASISPMSGKTCVAFGFDTLSPIAYVYVATSLRQRRAVLLEFHLTSPPTGYSQFAESYVDNGISRYVCSSRDGTQIVITSIVEDPTFPNIILGISPPGAAPIGITGSDRAYDPSGLNRCAIIGTTGTFKCFIQDSEYRLMNKTPVAAGNWSRTFNFYSSLASPNDLGSSIVESKYNIGPKWFLGTTLKTILPNELSVQSKHGRYKYTVTVITTGSMLHVSTVLVQRHNDVYAIKSGEDIRFYNNGNIEISNNSTVTWTTNMSDANGSNQTYVVLDKVKPTITQNGNYLTYWHSNGTFRQCYYPFNSSRFRDYGIYNDQIFTNSLDRQQDFCFANLQQENTSTNIKFRDDRCCCVGGLRLFNQLFINTDTLSPSDAALLLNNLPCIMLDCSKTLTNQPPTNVFRLLQDKCKVNIVICSVTIRQEDQASIGNIGVVQSCGAADIPLPSCITSADCPINSSCVNSRCRVNCNSDAGCANLGSTFVCRDGTCVDTTTGLSIGAIAGIATAAVVVIVLISVLCWYFLVYKKAHP